MTPSNTEEKTWCLSNFTIVKPKKTITKTREVFNALKNLDCKGPKLNRDIFDILLLFQCFPVALLHDIAGMYLRIRMSVSSRPFHCFLWRKIDQSRPPDVYEFSYLMSLSSTICFLEACKGKPRAVSEAAKTILKSAYTDDSMDPSPSTDECI